jgi:hypothetical protein
MTPPQRWLSLSGICDSLGITEAHARWLAQKGYLAVLPAPKSSKAQRRYLDPTPDYADKLRLTEAFYGRMHPLPKDFDLTALLTLREVATIMNWGMSYAGKYVVKHKVPSTKVGKYTLYSVADVRDILWKREGRSISKQSRPFQILELVNFFLRYQAEQTEGVPTEAEIQADNRLSRQFDQILKLKSPEKEEALSRLWARIETARTVAQSVHSVPSRGTSGVAQHEANG